MAVGPITVIKAFFDDVSTQELKALDKDERIALATQAAETMGWEPIQLPGESFRWQKPPRLDHLGSLALSQLEKAKK